ncbi:glycoside hydrolase N-terminal domain-containing protein [Kitasatospora sp. NPDC048239]|uniref:glycoside hydrolase N-terminal domain-containing protein n=1 Tax=Kitasatospora sp. NPDC048239 TaxID=3364046 RepID=UPI0037174E03
MGTGPFGRRPPQRRRYRPLTTFFRPVPPDPGPRRTHDRNDNVPTDSRQPTTDPLWYRRAADGFLEALPLGNGRLGAMTYGGGDGPAWCARMGRRRRRAARGPDDC